MPNPAPFRGILPFPESQPRRTIGRPSVSRSARRVYLRGSTADAFRSSPPFRPANPLPRPPLRLHTPRMALPTIPTPARRRRLRLRLLTWYGRNRRQLPWRVDDPYRVLVSEFMLQQTRVAAVLPYFDRFLGRFPTMNALAGAGEEDVRAAWSGLGYYRRARNLQATARILVAEHGGRLPRDLDGLRNLPGVGPYTAAALGSIVHGIPEAVVDGNVVRLLARLAAIKDPVNREPAKSAIKDLADHLLDPGRPGDWNQATMELGALVCTPREPACPACPWRPDCHGAATGDPRRFPVKDRPRAPVAVERAVGVIRRDDRVLLVRRRDPRLLDGTWEFPGVDLADEDIPRASLDAHLERIVGGDLRVGAEIARVRHAVTHRRITVRAFAVHREPPPRARKNERMWMDAGSLDAVPTAAATAKLLTALAAYLRSPAR